MKKLFSVLVTLSMVTSTMGAFPVSAFATASNKIEICHKTGNGYKYMDTPNQSAHSAHIGHGDFDYTGDSEVVDKDAWCNSNIPTPPTPPACNATASAEYVSDTSTQVFGGTNAVLLSPIHPAWTASIPGASWVWTTNPVEGPTNDVDLTKVFVENFTIVGTPLAGTLDVAADNTYSVKVNGHVVPVSIDQDNFQSTTQDSYNISAFLVSGANTVEFTVTNLETNGQDADPANNPAGLMYKVSVQNNECVNPQPEPTPTAILEATKIVCDSESDLPNWGTGGADIDGNTATTFLANHPNCHREAGWQFMWSLDGAGNPGDNNLATSISGWNTFGMTDTNGSVTTAIPSGGTIWVREVLKDGYVPFSFPANPDNSNNVSAELYCHTDVLNYDNWDFISGVQASATYHCIAFNAPKSLPPPTTCPLDGQQSGWYSEYFNYKGTDPFMQDGGTGIWMTDRGNPTLIASDSYQWYTPKYYKFNRVDANLMFGSSWFPFSQAPYNVAPYADPAQVAQYGNEYHFGVHSSATVTATTTKAYAYSLASDDDAWILVDGVIAVDNHGIHSASTQFGTINMTAGTHVVDVYFAERQKVDSELSFKFIDPAVQIVPHSTLCTPVVTNTCVLPSTVGGPESILLQSSDESSVQTILTNAGYSINAANDQTNIQEWDGTNNTVDFTVKYLGSQTAGNHVFGYYVNNDLNTFVPIFQKGSQPGYGAVPAGVIGQSYPFSVSNVSKVGFAISMYYNDNTYVWATKKSLNAGSEDHAVVYNPSTNEYVISYEDLPLGSADKDYNDTTVSVKVTGCHDVPVCNPQQELLQNGSFETPDISTGAYDIISDSNPLLNWLVSWVNPSSVGRLGLEIQDHIAGTPADGNQFAELDGDHPVNIYQNITTVPGQAYTLTFKYSPRPGRDSADNTINVQAGGLVLGANITADGTANGDTVWSSYTRNFTATTTSTIVGFNDVGTDTSFGGYIDGASLRCVPPVPPLECPEGQHVSDNECVNDVPTCTEGQHLNNQNQCVPNEGGNPSCSAGVYTDNSDNSGAIRFETSQTYSLGSINGQNNWSATGPYDFAVVPNTYGYASFGSQSFRISDGTTSGSFGDWAFAPGLTNGAGESGATAGAFSVGTRQTHFEAQFDIASTRPCEEQSGLHISVSPDRGDGSRMSYLRFEDSATGLDVFFDDVQGTGSSANFVETQIATNLNRSIPHKVKFVMDFVDGASNDVVKIYIDGSLVHTGTSWENYYRFDSESVAEQSPRIVKTLIFQARGTAHPANTGKGFLIDNLTYSTSNPVVVDEGGPTDDTPTFRTTGGGGGGGGNGPVNYGFVNGGGNGNGNGEGKVLGASCEEYLHSYLKLGKNNDVAEVKKLQQFLNDYLHLSLPVTGFFGNATFNAVKQFQVKEGIEVIGPWAKLGLLKDNESTGYVYKTTKRRINLIMCDALNIPVPQLP